MKPQHVGLVGDVGGTNARFALVDPEGRVRNLHVFEARKYASLTDVIAEYLERTTGRKRPPRAVIAVAGPVLDGEIEFTNLDWQVSEGDLLAAFEFEAVKLINDFAAQALACPRLEGPDLNDVREVAEAVRGRFLYSGGIGDVEHLSSLAALRQVNLAGVIVGKALYEGRFTVAEGQAALDSARPADGYSRPRIARHRR